MGQKVHPYGFRLGTLYGWQSNWFANKNYAKQLHEDLRIRKFIKKKLYHAGISKVEIERTGEKVVVNIHTARPGILIGKRGAEVETLRQEIGKLTPRDVFINVREIRKAELDAQLVAENIALQLERRVAFRRAMKKSMISTMKFGAKGIRIQCAGRLGGAEMGRREWYRDGGPSACTARSPCPCSARPPGSWSRTSTGGPSPRTGWGPSRRRSGCWRGRRCPESGPPDAEG